MPFIMPEGTRVPTGTDNYALTDDLRKMAESQSTIVSVASTTMRSALVAQLTAGGRTPSATRPLFVKRQDLPAHYALEYTTDGTNWASIPSETVANLTPFQSGYTIFEGVTRIVRQGNVVVMSGGVLRTGATISSGVATPVQLVGVPVASRPWSSRRLGLAPSSMGMAEVRYDAATTNITVQYATSVSMASGSWWVSLNGLSWTMDA